MEITEAEAIEIAGDAEGDIVAEEMNDETDSSVVLRKFPSRFVLGASCDATDTYKFYVFDDLEAAQVHFDQLAETMRSTGTPFGAAS
ncbi:MAG: hypothetical protein K2Y42_05610 [Hyphomicrobium sp.]|jgi:hypothetical protein|uniref:hypothetical protein n=1 Tax=Hyphomicrobium sp. TaxID=82 RepID=UPI0025C3A391|nr:hypothetical protein [Hyphomicrobium sp.]MBX9862211.1 hypothetical protein [Hyphomicrobium sp.]